MVKSFFNLMKDIYTMFTGNGFRPHFRELNLQRLKLLWFGWGIIAVNKFALSTLSLADKDTH